MEEKLKQLSAMKVHACDLFLRLNNADSERTNVSNQLGPLVNEINRLQAEIQKAKNEQPKK
jgi:peptidoglycan hydrolase CwlO-like protein